MSYPRNDCYGITRATELRILYVHFIAIALCSHPLPLDKRNSLHVDVETDPRLSYVCGREDLHSDGDVGSVDCFHSNCEGMS